MHTELLGKLISNLWSLETLIRYFLAISRGERLEDLSSYNIGDEVELNNFTNFYTLNELVIEFNKVCSEDNKLNKKVILSIRNPLAHGRIVLDKTQRNNESYLIKFCQAHTNNMTKIENRIFISKNDGEWLKNAIGLIRDEMFKVVEESKLQNIPITVNLG